MTYFPINRELKERFDRIRRKIRRLQQGGCIDSLQRLGIPTDRQVGASFVSLKALAATYPADEQLALMLWGTQCREEQIIACLLFPVTLNKEKITQFMCICDSYEIAEYIGSLFLSRYPQIIAIATEWADSENPFLQTASITACARHLILYKNDPLITAETFTVLYNKDYKDPYVKMVAERYKVIDS